MRRIMFFLGFSALLGGCTASGNERVADLLNTSPETVSRSNSALPVMGLILSTPPVNHILFGPCREEFMTPEGRKAQCELHARLWSETSAAQRNQANGQAMAYQPGELQCWRTLGFKTECVVVAGTPRPVYLNAAPQMGGN
jgi:hypothetical protein